MAALLQLHFAAAAWHFFADAALAGGPLRYNSPAMAGIGYEDLVCPLCKRPLVVTPKEDALQCGSCRRSYPIQDGIPILLVDEAVTERQS